MSLHWYTEYINFERKRFSDFLMYLGMTLDNFHLDVLQEQRHG